MKAGAPTTYVIRDLTNASEMRVLEDLQRAAWNYSDLEVHPSNIFRIHAHTGGVVAAAYSATDLPVGFVYGFPAYRNGRVWHHSHMLALRPEWRGYGVAEALKRHQADRVRQMNLSVITWTFDPLVTRNARFNLGKLGARATAYHPDWYVSLGLAADRLMVEWDISREFPAHRAPPAEGERVLEMVGSLPAAPKLHSGALRLLAQVPLDAFALPVAQQWRWRLAVREVLGHYLGAGYVVTDLAREGEQAFYLLQRAQDID